jgi:SAM-dependent methyltransferase
VPPRPDQSVDWREVLIARAALETGLLGALEQARPVDEAADAAGLDRRAARIVSAALVGTGYLEEDGGGLRATERARALLRPSGEGGDPAGELHLEARAMRSHLGLEETLRTGMPVDDVSAGDPVTIERFMRAMRQVAAPRAPHSVAALGAPAPGARLLDVGGAPGTYARAFAEAGWDVTVLDRPGTLEVTGSGLRAGGIATVPGDATRALPGAAWDAVYLGNVVHLFDPATARGLVARAGAALAPGGTLAVQEVLGDVSPQGPAFGVMMLVSTEGGDAYPEAAYHDWMAAAGCPVERVIALEHGWHHLLLGTRVAA